MYVVIGQAFFTHTHTRTHTCTCTRTHSHARTHTHTHTHTYIYTHTHTRTRTHSNAHMHARTHTRKTCRWSSSLPGVAMSRFTPRCSFSASAFLLAPPITIPKVWWWNVISSLATPYVCRDSSRVGEMITTPVPGEGEGRGGEEGGEGRGGEGRGGCPGH